MMPEGLEGGRLGTKCNVEIRQGQNPGAKSWGEKANGLGLVTPRSCSSLLYACTVAALSSVIVIRPPEGTHPS